jgi:hypothetical protein
MFAELPASFATVSYCNLAHRRMQGTEARQFDVAGCILSHFRDEPIPNPVDFRLVPAQAKC